MFTIYPFSPVDTQILSNPSGKVAHKTVTYFQFLLHDESQSTSIPLNRLQAYHRFTSQTSVQPIYTPGYSNTYV